MTRAEEYRHLADVVRIRAKKIDNPNLSAQWERLAEGYALQAEQAEQGEKGSQLAFRYWKRH
jgi:hypothetical protein